jgi:HNH endonuclease
MSQKIPEQLRRQVASRAKYRCEYCRRLETDSFIRYQTDHIISRKHGGKTILENLAHSCPICNNSKGTDISTFLENEEILVHLFNPRKNNWFDHFEVEDGLIIPKTDIGAATIKLLKFNEIDRILERLDLISAGLFP